MYIMRATPTHIHRYNPTHTALNRFPRNIYSCCYGGITPRIDRGDGEFSPKVTSPKRLLESKTSSTFRISQLVDDDDEASINTPTALFTHPAIGVAASKSRNYDDISGLRHFQTNISPPEDSDPTTLPIEHSETSSPLQHKPSLELEGLPPRRTESLDTMGYECISSTEIPASNVPSPDNTISPLPLSPRPRTIRSDSSATFVTEQSPIVIPGNLPSFFLDARLNVEVHTSSFPFISTSRVDPSYVPQRSTAFEELLLSHVDCLKSRDPYLFNVNVADLKIVISSDQRYTRREGTHFHPLNRKFANIVLRFHINLQSTSHSSFQSTLDKQTLAPHHPIFHILFLSPPISPSTPLPSSTTILLFLTSHMIFHLILLVNTFFLYYLYTTFVTFPVTKGIQDTREYC